MSEIEKKEAEETKTEEANAADEAEATETDSEESKEATEEASEEVTKESPEARLARLERQTKQLRKKLGVEDRSDKSEKTSKSKKSDEFDEAQLAYLTVKGIDADEDIDWTREQLKERGGNLRELLGKKWFQAELKERKDARTNLEATSITSKRSSSKPADLFERAYAEYEKTGKLPADHAMQEKIIAKRREAESSGNKFTSNPVVGNW